MTTIDQRGLGKQIKRVLPKSLFRMLTIVFNGGLKRAPYGVKYGVGGALRRGKYPYSVVSDGDTVLQLGAPRDTLHAGRSRAIHFARLVGSGAVIVMEPDPENCAALRQYIAANGLEKRVKIFEVGGWNSRTTLTFLSSDQHPAANVIADVKDISEDLSKERGYRTISIDVDTVDHVLSIAGVKRPKLISVTTNGAEKQIIEGAKRTLEAGVPYISLASTQSDLVEFMQQLKESYSYEYIARDDRGYCFRRR